MIDKNELSRFLVKAKVSTYAAGDSANKINNEDKSMTIVFNDEDWKYHDNYFGGEPYGGREVVFYKNKPVYIMTYYGNVNASVKDINEVYSILMNALKLIPEDAPYRGPKEYKEANMVYKNNFNGEVDDFSGKEIIEKDGIEIYRASYMGGFVDC